MLHKTQQQHQSSDPHIPREDDYSPHVIIDIHGLVIECISESPDLVRDMVRPFNFFKVGAGRPALTVTADDWAAL